ncbi:MAG: M23 family metallopeptidase [Reichenbachiella sp.]|uniref:M23 family metallopeptidase n=1 Tax=Reichenbachiella sp. TaxID=2184521 RepID=UPI0032632500
MKLNRPLFFLLVCLTLESYSQIAPAKGDFMFPVRPRQENYLAGTMGELRSSHFHSGLDIKTSGITGLPVYAAADGYVQRVRVALSGYGNALYLVHPHNGTVTVYAHLKSFHEDVAAYVRSEQYKAESFAVDLYPEKDKYVFKKGEVIALSGNSGSSSGPHLHFEVRTLRHRVLDPLDYGFDEIVDKEAPVLGQVAFVTMDKHSRVNGMFGRVEFDVLLDDQGGAYIAEGISLFGNIGVEIYAYDKFDGARNRNGVRFQTMYFDGHPVFEQKIEQINFSTQRNILVHTNYKRAREGGRRFNKLYVDNGNMLKFYDTNSKSGLLSIFDPMEHTLDVRLEDAYGNVNMVNLKINDKEFSRDRKLKHTYGLDANGYDVIGDFLEIESEEGYCSADFYLNGEKRSVDMAYYTTSSHHFLWDLREGLPDSAKVCDRTYIFDFATILPVGLKTQWQGEGIAMTVTKNALFDSAYLQYRKYENEQGFEVFGLNNPTTPLRKFVTLNVKPNGIYDLLKSRVYSIGHKGQLSFVGGEWEGDELVFKTRDLVPYTIATDSVAPKISPKKSSEGQVRFKIEDEMSGVQSILATLNDEWILMNYDAKSGLIWSDEKVVISGRFTLAVKDQASNIARFEAIY